MKANGSGRSTNGTWTTISPSRGKNRTLRHDANLLFNKFSNPYEVLSDSSIHLLKKYTFPNGEVIFTSFQSIEDLSTYFSNHPKYQQNTPKLADRILSNSFPLFLSHENNMENTHNKKNNNDNDTHNRNRQINFHTKLSNPQNPDRDTTTSHSQYPYLTTMASKSITKAINEIFGEVDIENVQVELARSMCKKIAALMFISMPEWIDILSMDHHSLKLTLYEFKKNTCINYYDRERRGR